MEEKRIFGRVKALSAKFYFICLINRRLSLKFLYPIEIKSGAFITKNGHPDLSSGWPLIFYSKPLVKPVQALLPRLTYFLFLS